MNNEEYILEVKDLKMHFDITTGFFKTTPLKAVDGVSFKIHKGETLGVVGESGCGKTTLGRTIINLYKPSSGDIIYNGVPISPYSDLKKIKKEEQFQIKSSKFEANKIIKTFKKDYKEKISKIEKPEQGASEEVINKYNSEVLALNNELEGKINEVTTSLNEQILELKKVYKDKYDTEAANIEKKCIDALNLKNGKLSLLEVVEKGSVDTTECDTKTLEFKTVYNKIVADAKAEKEPKVASAKATKKEELLKQKSLYSQQKLDLKASRSDAKVNYLNNLSAIKNDANLTDEDKTSKIKEVKDAYKKELKKFDKVEHSEYIDDIVAREKIIGNYKVELSKASGEYFDVIDIAKKDLDKQISIIRSENKYYNYIDQKNSINKEYKDAIKQIKSSSKLRMKDFRKKVTMVFQDPYSSLNPRMTVADIIAEPLDVNHLYKTKEERRTKVLELMKMVGLSPEQSTRYAHEFSGGQRQRIGIARALAVNPEFIICDEPVSALDVSIQAQVINTFEDLQKNLGLTYLFIAHDLLVVRHISDRIAVMYLGKVVELAETDELYNSPLHPYTQSLLSAVPVPDPIQARVNQRIVLTGDVPSPLNVPSGCPFRTRCNKACERCKTEVPTLKEVKPGHYVSCLLVD